MHLSRLITSSVRPPHSLQSQEFLDSSTTAEPAEAALLGTTMGQVRFVVDTHAVYVDGTVVLFSLADVIISRCRLV